MSRSPHVLVIPFPAQGHVIPLLEFSQCLAEYGFRVTFVNSEYNQKRILKSLEGKNNDIGEKIHLVSIPDGLEPWDDRSNSGKVIQKVLEVMPGKLKELIEEINSREDEKIACVIADGVVGWAIEVAQQMKIRAAAVWTSSAASVALMFTIPKLIYDGIIDNDGTPTKKQMIQLAPNMPAINTEDFWWARFGDLITQKIVFDYTVKIIKVSGVAEFQFCNSTNDLEPAALAMFPEILAIGPLLASNRHGNSAGFFWPEDLDCLKWLDQQQPNSVIYVAFGSHTVFDKIQFQELALGLEICNRSFLWVVRPDITNDANNLYPEGFQDRVATRSRIVNWAPQQKVLSHPSIACFLSHCGWNSTMEGVSNGIPFLCWPYFADQIQNEMYICDVWKIGLGFERDERRIKSGEEIKKKIEELLCNGEYKANALKLQEKVMTKEGTDSYNNFKLFVDWV